MLFDSTVRKELARAFGATLVVILTIVMTMMLVRTLGLAARGVVSPQDVVLFLGYTVLGYLSTILALSLFVAVVVSLGRMYRDSEMAIWFASGIGIARFARPVLRTSWPVLAVVAALVLVVWPWGNQQSLDLRARYEQRGDLSRVSPGVFQTSSDGSRVFFIERERPESVDARNVFIVSQRGSVEAVTSARSGRLEGVAPAGATPDAASGATSDVLASGSPASAPATTAPAPRWLVLEKGQRNETDAKTGERSLASFERYSIVAEDGRVQRAQTPPTKSLPSLTLLREPTRAHLGELSWRLGLLLGACNLVLLGIGLAATNPRRASNWNLLFALLSFLVYYNLINLSQAWVANGQLGMGAALVLLHGSVLALALALLWWRDRGAVFSLRRAPAAPALSGTV
jgi:lipopolysaccharide export system permease protein